MKAIIIGAGRGRRLGNITSHQPKSYVRVGERRILDWVLEALDGVGLESTVFIGGYQIDRIRSDYPSLTYCHNTGWEKNNILESLLCAEEHMTDGFVCTYADILFRNSVVRKALEHPADIVLCVDTHWRDRYVDRSDHPEDDAEKVTAEGDQVTNIKRTLQAEESIGEYIGVARFSAGGAAQLRQHYHRVRQEFAGKPWPSSKVFEQAYLIEMLHEMILQGVSMHMVTTDGDYMEIDTEKDLQMANEKWVKRFLEVNNE